MKQVDTLIIGAGISGLTFAINSKKDYLVLEKENTIGGLCRTFYQDGFIWDFAGHFFHFATSKVKALFENAVSTDDLIRCKKNTNIYYNDLYVNYPFQMNIHNLDKKEFIDCLYDLFFKNEKKEYDNFEEMLYGKFGKSITEKFLKPYNEKLYACPLNDLDTDAMGRFFPYADTISIIKNMKMSTDNTYNSTFEYPKLGAQYFINILAKRIKNENVLLNTSVEKIDVINKIAYTTAGVIKYNNLINTIPLNHFLRILDGNIFSNFTTDLSCNKVLVFNLGFDKESINKKTHWTYFPNKTINFYRAGYYNNILGMNKLSMYIEIGFKENDFINVDEQLNLTLANLKKCGIIDEHKLISYNYLIINPGYVHITKESQSFVDKTMKKFSEFNIYSIGRYGKWTYCSIEDCMLDSIKLAENLNLA